MPATLSRPCAFVALSHLLLLAGLSTAWAGSKDRDHGFAPVILAASRVVSDETDRLALDQAMNACTGNGGDTAEEFRSFFDAFILSRAVRLKYSAPQIHYSVYGNGGKPSDRVLLPKAYKHFPIKRWDYYYKSVKPARAGDENEYIEFDVNQSSSNDVSVEWWRMHYDGRSGEGDGLGNPIDDNGTPIPKGTHPDPEGQLLFHPAGNCWEFSDDIRFKKPR